MALGFEPSDGYQDNPQDGAADEPQALSVSGAMALAKGALESVVVRLIGEVSEFSNKPGYKAVYFTVKDTKASLPCMMWNNRYAASGVELSVGALVELTGRFSLYAAKGRMNFDVFSIALAGEGKLRMEVAQRARRLEAEGLMNPERKRPLPPYPQTIGLVTSPRGAAIHDVLRTLRRRYPMAKILIAGVPVEGPTAAAGMIEALHRIEASEAEVLLLVRGGGSFEDLMPFNDEALARAIASSSIPVVTGIGHEPDTSIADMVADVRASTPTAAAETVAPDQIAVAAMVAGEGEALQRALQRRLERTRVYLERIAHRPLFQEPQRLFATEAQTIDDLRSRLNEALPHRLEAHRQQLNLCAMKLHHGLQGATQLYHHEVKYLSQQFKRLLAQGTIVSREQVTQVGNRLQAQGPQLLTPYKTAAALRAARLQDLSPLGVIARGYAMATTNDGAIVSSIEQAEPGEDLRVQVKDGVFVCTIDQKEKMTVAAVEWKE